MPVGSSQGESHMKVMFAFLVGMFIAAGIPRTRRLLARPIVLIIVCTLVAASFYSLSVAG
jgi:hypothetical protein